MITRCNPYLETDGIAKTLRGVLKRRSMKEGGSQGPADAFSDLLLNSCIKNKKIFRYGKKANKLVTYSSTPA
jgi:hypothetical protein